MENEDYKNSILIAEELVEEICKGGVNNTYSSRLNDWKIKQPELYKQISAQSELAEKIAFYESVDVETAHRNIRKRIFKNRRRNLFIRIGGIAAMLAILLTIGSLIFLSDEPHLKDDIPVWAKTIPGSEKSMIVTSDNQFVRLDNPMLVVQKGQIINGKGDGKIQIAIKNEQKTELNKLDVPAGGEHSLTLADGSLVKVNSATELWFPTDFGQKTRQVQLQGEAYFQIKQDRNHPFIVSLPHNLKVKVTGTTFNVNAYKEEKEINIALVEGSIDIMKDSEILVSLTPGQLFTYQKDTQEYEVAQTDVSNQTDWTSDIFIFRDESIDNIMRKLSRWYNVEINVNHEIKDIRYTGILSRKQPLNETLEALRMTNELDFNIQENKKVKILEIK